jgi:hydroxyacylglutathione hydrolase
MLKIHPIEVLQDNYVWAIHSPDGKHVVVVDPGEAPPVLDYIQQQGLILEGILLTHRHLDHTGGVLGLLEHFKNIPVYGSLLDKVPGITHFVKEGDEIILPKIALTLKVLDIPGHTLGHVAYVADGILFSGDTLFSCGSGKIFEGTPSQMAESLGKLKQLPPDTLMYCGHEYTLSNIAFAQKVDPDNVALAQRKKEAAELREKDLPSLPVTMATELQTNPFLRCEEPTIVKAVQNYSKVALNDPVEVLAHLRQWKNSI